MRRTASILADFIRTYFFDSRESDNMGLEENSVSELKY